MGEQGECHKFPSGTVCRDIGVLCLAQTISVKDRRSVLGTEDQLVVISERDRRSIHAHVHAHVYSLAFSHGVSTGLNNVCACTRSHGSRCRQQPRHHNKPRKNGGVFKSFVWCPVYGEKESQTENGRKKF